MVDVAVASQLQQWTFEKPTITTHPNRMGSDSAASSPILCDESPETVRIDAASPEESSPKPRKESIVLQERYMSSEEALSAVDDASDSEYDYDDVVIHDVVKECKARTMSISRWDKGKSCDMAVVVSYAFVGRPKVVELDCRSPTTDLPPMQQRSASVANLPISAISQLRKDAAQRLSMKVTPSSRLSSMPTSRSASPPVEMESRRPSTSHTPSSKNDSTLNLTDSVSTTSSFKTAPSSRSISPAVDELLARPTLPHAYATSSTRSSVYIPTQSRTNLSRTLTTQSQWAPLTPSTPADHSFLSSDPYENSNTHSASPIIKPAPHRRLRSISMKLALAKIAIGGPSKKTYDARLNGKAPATPSTPYTPLTPQTAPLESSSSFMSPQRLRRASTILRPKSRHSDTTRGPSPETVPPMPTFSAASQNRMSKMQARGANEIEPTLILPPCPSDTDDDPMSSIKTRRLKKRKSLMSLMDSL